MGDGASGGGRRVGEYELLRPIGSGAYSQVWLGRHLARGTEVAVKEIAMERLSRKLRESLLSEVDILRRICHPNIIALHDSIKDHGKIYFILEYCRGGDLHAYLQRHKRVSETVAKHFIRQLASGLQMLRDNNVVHRDLKPQNILLVENNENSLLKIADFGFAKFLQPFALAETLCGSPLYMAPEVMQAQKYDAKADLWSVGVILYQLVTGFPPFNGDNQIQLLKNILRSHEIRFPPDCELSHGCIDLCRKLLRLNSVERLTVEEFVNHPFLSEHAPERTLCWTPSDIRDGFPFNNSSPTRPSSQNSQEDCMPFPLDDESSGQDESPVPESKSAMKLYGFAMGKRLDKTSGQSPSKHVGLFSRYIMGNNYAPSSQCPDHPGKKAKESKIDEIQSRKGGYPKDQEYVFVSGPHPDGSSSSTNASRQRNLPSKDNSSVSPPKLTLLSAPMPINGLAINRQRSAGTGSLDSHCSPLSGTSQGSADMSDAMDQPPSDYLTRIRLLEQYASAIAGLVKEEIKVGGHLEAFSIQLIVLATWKQAICICNSYVASSRESPSQDIPMKGLSADAPHLLANSQLADDACMQIERQFLIEVEYAEELAGTVGQIADATEMPDAIEIIFQSALQLGRRGGVDEMMGKAEVAMTWYMKAVSMLRFLLIEAPSLALNPPLTLTRYDRHRLRTYIEALNTRLGQLQCQRH
ncbi:serine/threonine-protein kinase ATG1c-like isoform X2 [Phragmites australis]|uniref:serine/threonine-protein kinase ATG1c-like isoform X2 n=1 Tax=Phragmites australis TaxID=29695 RepID=UPI002D782EB8|nr:serine/threonine-protein kinase ATG1c-like isoform X2 [Phragmites australis]